MSVTWSQVTCSGANTPNAPWGERKHHSAAYFKGYVYVVGGTAPAGTILTDVWRSSDGCVTWEEATSDLGEATYNASLVVLGDAMYLMAGRITAWLQMSSVWRTYDGEIWEEVLTAAAAPFSKRYAAATCVHNDEIWLVGGTDHPSGYFGNHTDVWIMSPAEVWREAAEAIPRGLAQLTLESVNGNVYAIGGRSVSAPAVDNAIYYTPDETTAWGTGVSFPQPPGHPQDTAADQASIVYDSGRSIAVVGDNAKIGNMWTSENAGDAFVYVADVPTFSPARDNLAVAGFEDSVFAFGGQQKTGGTNGSNDVWVCAGLQDVGDASPYYDITPDLYFDQEQPANTEELANIVEVTTSPLAEAAAATRVYESSEGLTIASGETVTTSIKYSLDTTDKAVLDGAATLIQPGITPEVSPVSASIDSVVYYSWGAEVTVSAAASDTYSIVVDGKLLSLVGQETVVARDEASITEYGELTYDKIKDNALVQTRVLAEKIADSVVATYATVRKDVAVQWCGDTALKLADKFRVPTYIKGSIDHRVICKTTRNQIQFDGAYREFTKGRKISDDTTGVVRAIYQDTDGAADDYQITDGAATRWQDSDG